MGHPLWGRGNLCFHNFRYPLLTVYEAALGDCLIGLAFMMEASTPFVSARAILELLGETYPYPDRFIWVVSIQISSLLRDEAIDALRGERDRNASRLSPLPGPPHALHLLPLRPANRWDGCMKFWRCALHVFHQNLFTGKRDNIPLQVQMICRSIHARHSAVPRAKGVHLIHALLLRHAALLVRPHGQRGCKDANEGKWE